MLRGLPDSRYPSYKRKSFRTDNMADVIVIGGGIVGAATAYALTQDGLDVLLIDQYEAGHTNGSSHGDGRIVRFNYSEAIYVELAKIAYPAWEALGKAVGKPFIQKSGLIEYGTIDSPPIAASQRILTDHNISYEMLTATEANERFPQMHFEDNHNILYQPDGGVAFATPAVLALWQLVRDSGSTALENTKVTQIEAHADSVTVHTENDTYTAEKLVITAGAWTKQLLAQINIEIPIEVTQEVLAYFPSTTEEYSHRVGDLPCLIDYQDIDAPFYSLPQIEVAGVKVGYHHSGDVIQSMSNRPQASQSVLNSIQSSITRNYRYLSPEPLEVVTCLYSNTPDYHFILDTLPQYPNIAIGAGFSGHGFKFGPTIGRILANLVQNKPNLVSLDTFKLDRFANNEQLSKHLGA